VGLGALEATNDELFHVLAAQGLLEEGTLSIGGGGEYTRGAWYTNAAAAFMGLLGEGLWAARLPSLVAGSILVPLLCVWLWRLGEPVAGFLAGTLVALDPLLIELSQMARFYTFQHLAFLLGCIGVYSASTGTRSPARRGAFAAFAAGAFWVATELQVVSLIGIGGIGVFLLLRFGHEIWRTLPQNRRIPTATILAILLLLLGTVLLTQTELGNRVLGFTPLTPGSAPTAAHVGAGPDYYYAFFLDSYAPLWTLLPVLVLLAVRRKPTLTLFLSVVLGCALVVHSLHPWKSDRYISYALPLFFACASIGIVEGVRRLHAFAEQSTKGFLQGRTRRKVWTTATVAAVVLFAGVGNRAFVKTQGLLTRDHSYAFPLQWAGDGPISWARAGEELAPRLDQADVVVSTEHVKALYYLDRVDYVVRPAVLEREASEDGSAEEFLIDSRFARPLISTRASLERIVHCHESGLFVGERMKWNNPAQLPPSLTEFIGTSLTPIQLPSRWGITAYEWRSPIQYDRGRNHNDESTPCRGLPGLNDEGG